MKVRIIQVDVQARRIHLYSDERNRPHTDTQKSQRWNGDFGRDLNRFRKCN